MHKQAFSRYLSKKHRRPIRHYQEAITEILSGIQDQLKEGKTVRFMGFGTFYTRTRKPSKLVDVRTKKPIDVPALRLAAFRVGSLLRLAVRGKQAKKKGLGSFLKRAVRGKKTK